MAIASDRTTTLSQRLDERLIESMRPASSEPVGPPLWQPHPENQPQIDAFNSEADEIYFGGAAGGGKGLHPDTKIITPFGFRSVADIRVGQTVCAADGSPAQVIGVYPQPARPLYRIRFADGAEVLADDVHRWNYSVARKGRWRKSGRRWKVGTTAQLLDQIQEGRTLLIPVAKPLTFTRSYRYDMRVIPPYVLGALLGDGCISRQPVQITSTDDEILDRIFSETDPGDWRQDSEITWGARGATREMLLAELDRLDLWGARSWEKHIPEAYLWGTIDDRWALLRGLMDTDGWVSDGKAYFTSTSRQLAADVAWLVSSLGGTATETSKIATLDGEPMRRAYELYIRLPDRSKAFHLKRKQQACKTPTPIKRRIESIEYVGEERTVCLAVDHPMSLFVVGDGCVVTHNTDLVLGLAVTQHKRSVIFRRHYTDLTEVEERSREILGSTSARYNANDHIWRSIPGGRRLEFGAVQHESDKEKWKGRPHDLKAFDELPDFSESQYLYLTGWNRTTDPDQRCRVVATGNPPTTTEGAWVIERWAPWLDPDHPNPAKPGELRWFARLDDEDTEVDGPDVELYDDRGEPIKPKSRTFIPAFLEDNPYLADSGYRAQLQQLPEPLRSQLLYGDFSLSIQDDAWQVIPTSWIQAAFDRWEAQPKPETGLTAIGCDPARGGRDDATICKRFSNWYAPILSFPGDEVPDGPTLAAKIIEIMAERNVPVNIDPIGVGSSPHDALLANDVNSIPVNFAASARTSDGQPITDRSGRYKFRNVRAAAYWKLREALDPDHGEDLAIAPDRHLRQELTAHRWKLTVSGIQILDKAEVKATLGRSPNKADALVLASWVESLVGSWDDVGDMQIDNFESRWT